MRFVRIHGHVVPIKDERKKGAAIAGSGVALGIVTGKTTAGMMHESALAENAGRSEARAIKKTLNKFNLKESNEALKGAAKQIIKSKRLEKAAFRIRGAGFAAAAGLTAYGVKKAFKPKDESTVAAAAAVTTGVGYAAYSRGVGNRGFHAIKYAFDKVRRK